MGVGMETADTIERETPGAGSVLRKKLQGARDKYYDDGYKNRQKALRVRVSLAAAGALTTLLLGLKSSPPFAPYEAWLSAVALIISAFVPILTAWDSFCDYAWRWNLDRRTYHQLDRLLDDYDVKAANASPLPIADINDLYARYRAALDAMAEEGGGRRQDILGASQSGAKE